MLIIQSAYYHTQNIWFSHYATQHNIIPNAQHKNYTIIIFLIDPRAYQLGHGAVPISPDPHNIGHVDHTCLSPGHVSWLSWLLFRIISR